MLPGIAFAQEKIEAERTALCGARHAHLAEHQALRTKHVTSPLVLGGGRAEINRTRVRSAGGHEFSLPSWQMWGAREPLEQRAVEQMVLGGSSRRYARSLERCPMRSRSTELARAR